MSNFSVSRNNNRIVKKKLNNQDISIVNNNNSLASSYDIYEANINTLSLNNTVLNVDANEFNFLNSTEGIASASKALIADNNNNITGINQLSCNSININGTIIPSANNSSSASSYLTEIVPGIANNNKALVLNENKNISNIKTLSTNSINVNNYNITVNSNNNYNINNLSYNVLNNDNNWTSICWSNKLNLFAAVADSGNNRIMTSPDGITWTSITNIPNNDWKSICWSNELSLFIAVASSGINNRIIKSTDGITWNNNNIVYNDYNEPIINNKQCLYSNNNFSFYLILNDGTVKSWGKNDYGQLGIGNITNTINIPVTVSGLTNVNKLYCFSSMVYAVLNDNTVKAWGSNGSYQLGDGTTINRLTPVSISDLTNTIKIVSQGHSLALFADGTVKAWGYNQYGGLLNLCPINSSVTVPTIIPDLINVIDIIAAGGMSAFLLSDGTIKTCGSNNSGQLGTGNSNTSFNQLSLVTVPNISNAIAIYYQSNSMYALLNDNTVKSWGSNGSGQLGDNSTIQRTIPVTVSGLTNVKELVTHMFSTYAILNDNTVKSWGHNNNGQLGDNSTIQRNSPVTVSGLTNVKKILTNNYNGGQCCLAILNDDSIKVWGNNTVGQLGLNNTTNQLIPITNTIITNNYTNIILDIYTIGYISKNNLLLFCGNNQYGQLGNNTYTNSSIFDYVRNDINNNPLIYINQNLNPISNTNYQNNNWSSIVWSNDLNLFVAIANSGNEIRVITSSNGLNWNPIICPINNNWISICYSSKLSLFVAISNTGKYRIMYSYNGIDWFLLTNLSASFQNNWISICWSPELSLFVAIANSGSNLMYSDNGLNWYLKGMPYSLNYQSIIWISEYQLFIIISLSGNANKILKSSNGLDWEFINLNNYYTNPLSCLTWSPKLEKLAILSSNITNSNIDKITYLTTWNLCQSPYDTSSLNSIIWINELNFFIAVGISGTIIRSINGIDWIKCNSPVNVTWNDICWSSSLNLLVAISQGMTNAIITSSDGINWIATDAPSSQNYFSICWSSELSLFVAVASTATAVGNVIITSSDGINWIHRTGAGNGNWKKIIWVSNLNLFIVVGSTAGSRVMTSPNGINWTSRSAAAENNWTSVVWSSTLSLLVAVSNSGSTDRVMTSTNGTSWTIRSINSLNWNNIIWISELNYFVAISPDNNGYIMYSNNGINWISYQINITNITRSPTNLAWSSKLKCLIIIANSNHRFNIFKTDNIFNIAIVNNTKTIEDINFYPLYKNQIINKSTTKYCLNNWYYTNASINNTWTSICYSSDLKIYVAISNSGTSNRVISSIDSINWTTRISAADNNWTSICYSSELTLFVAVANSGTGNRVMTSTNGTTWTIRTSAADNNWTSVCWSPELSILVAVSNSGTNNRVMTSLDGITWTIRVSAANNDWNSICYSSELMIFVAVASSGINRIMYSYDGINWIAITSPVNNNWTSICWSDELMLFVAISNTGNNDRIITSSDGINWTSRISPEDNSWNNIIWIQELHIFIAISSLGTNRLMYSYDGIIWKTINLFINNSWQSICWNPELSILTMISNDGTNNNIIYSNHFYPTQFNTILSNSYKFDELTGYFLATPGLFAKTSEKVLTHQVELESISNQLSLFSSNNTVYYLNLNSLGELSFTSAINIVNHNSIDQGLALNNTLITSTSNQINAYKNITNGIVDSNKVIIPDKGLNIFNINQLSVNQLNNLDVFSIIGESTQFSPLVTNNNNNISNINKVEVNSLISKNNQLICYNNDFNNNILYNTIFYSTKLLNNITFNRDICWSPKLEMFVMVMSASASSNTYAIAYSYTGSDWISINTSSFILYSICWSNELSIFVACGNNCVLTSSDGINWTSQISPASYNWFSICWSPELSLFAMVAQSPGTVNSIATSPDGITWTLRASRNGPWYKIIWVSNLSLFIKSGSINTTSNISTSPDGINWTARTTPNVSFYGIAYSNTLNLLVAVGSNTILTSTNGLTWTTQNKNVISNSLYTILWISDLNIFIAACNSGDTDYRIIISKDGLNWIYRDTTNLNYSYYCIVWSPKYNRILLTTSSNNVVYSNITNENYYNYPTIDIKNLDNIFPSKGIVHYALNTWYNRNAIINNNWTSICYSVELSLFVAIANSGTSNRIMTSTDGINWISRNNPVDNDWTSICYSSNLTLFVAVSNSGTNNRIMTSSDGINWTSRTNPVDNDWTSICYSSELNLFVSVSNSGTNDRIMTSLDGINWTSRISPADNNWTSICYSSELNLFVAVSNSGTNNRIMTSSNGINWTSRNSPADNNWTSVCWNSNSNIFAAVSNSGTYRVMISYDGINWILQNASINNNWINIIYAIEINYFVALSNNSTNNIMISNDGINWITRQFTGLNCTSICWSPNLSLFTIVANNGINRVYNSKIILSTYQNTITFNPKYFKYNEFTGNIALGENNTTSLTGTTQLSLTLDSATKPGTSTWTVSSDIRLKENIEDADLDLCYNNIKNLPLKRYKWKDEYITYENTSDRHKLGWIAQDVETILPKAIIINNQYDIEDCKSLDIDQIIATLYGSIKKLINICELQDSKITELENKKKILNDFINSLEIVQE